MTRGRHWLVVATIAAIGCGFVGERIARAAGMLPAGWAWSLAAYVASAALGFAALVVILTKCGR